MTILNAHDPFADEPSSPHDDSYFGVGSPTSPYAGEIVHGCEGAYGIVWSPAEAREAARRLLLMADEAERLTVRSSA